MNKCLYCYKDLQESGKDFHSSCSRKFFGTDEAPVLDLGLNDIYNAALKKLTTRISVPGVQPKLSVDFDSVKRKGKETRMTMVGLWGRYILKPPFEEYLEMPEIEDLTMHMAEELKIKTAQHSLIRLKTGELAYISRRFDRPDNEKLHVEDMAQLSGELTEHKYRGSMERIGKLIHKYSDYPGLDTITFFELTLFCFITGNSDMHLKNFSLITDQEGEVHLSPAYDLLSTKMLLPNDKEETALTLNGKKSKLRNNDFNIFANNLNIDKNAATKIYKKYLTSYNVLESWIEKSFLKEETKTNYKELIRRMIERMN